MKDMSNCSICSKKLSGKQALYCSVGCKNVYHQSYQAQKRRGIKRKLHLITLLGGKCSRCNYSTNIAAMSFHHLGDKELKLDMRSLSNRKLDPVLKEVAKCVLLCQNCHEEVHNPNLNLAKLLIEPTALTAELHPRDFAQQTRV